MNWNKKGAKGVAMFNRDRGQEGSVLVAVLWSLFFLAALAVVLHILITPQLGLAARLRDRVVLRYLAKAGIQRAVIEIRADETQDFDGLNESWVNNEESFKEVGLTEEGYFSVKYLHFEGDEEEGDPRYGFIDEERKLNINKAPEDVLKRFFEMTAELAAQDASDIAGAIVDWRDADDEPSENGAESYYYKALPDGYPCKNALFEVLEELRLVKGVTPAIFDKVKNRVTVYGRGLVNINTADAVVLESIGFGTSLVEKIITYRNGNDGEEGTEDDLAFEKADSIIPTLSSAKGLLPEESGEMEAALERGIVGVRSENFHGYSLGKFRDEDMTVGIEFVMTRDEQVRFWKEE
ncbi:MAG: general secretion pathway protein GspK [Candidatus Omnitrophica bacterium]|nr:general secretion pathway protein GspK [Candidatus Omnitrophota bacterium]